MINAIRIPSIQLFLACSLILFGKTAVLADGSAKTFVEECNEFFKLPIPLTHAIGECTGTIKTMIAIGPFLIPELRFCPGDFAPPINGLAAMNRYVREHPDVLNSDRLSMLTLAFRDEWPCK